MTNTETCQLCKATGELKLSHITSKFMWRLSGLIGHNKKFEAICVNKPDQTKKHQQDGFKEYLLCSGCEGRRSTYEDVARRSLYSGIRNHSYISNCAVVTGLDYKSIKLYSMYQIWMMGVSKDPYYSNVNLGLHKNLLADCLLRDDPLEPWQYGTTVAVLGGNDSRYSGIFSQPDRTRKHQLNVYRYVVAGLHHFHYITNQKPHWGIQHLFLQKNGRMPIVKRELADYPHLTQNF